tara:strand:- start:3665 stop:5290 length:1626 start_codon:yes stop_codon:yes gene_type:complete
MEYLELREKNIKKLYHERDKARSKHSTDTINLKKQNQDLGEMMSYFLKNSEHILKTVEQTKEIKSKVNKGDYNLRGLYNFLLDKGMPSEVVQDITTNQHVRRKNRRLLEESISKMELKLNSIVSNSRNCLQNLNRSIRKSQVYKNNSKEAREFKKKAESFLESVTVDDYNGINTIYEAVKSEQAKDFSNSFNEFIDFLESYIPQFTEEEKRNVAEKNMKSLISPALNKESRKMNKNFFSTLDGKILTYATYDNTLRRAEKTADIEDINYLEFLEDKSDEAFSTLINANLDKIKNSMEILIDEEMLTEDESTYILANLKKEHKTSEAQKDKPSLEDIRLRSLVLQEDFKIPQNESVEIAQLIENEDIKRVSESLSSSLGRDTSRALIKDNPDLFLLDNGKVERFTSAVNKTINEARNYSNINDFNILENPPGFSSFSALHETIEKIESLNNKNDKSGNDLKISRKNRREIRDAFRGWDGRGLTSEIRRTLKKHNLIYITEGVAHPRIDHPDKSHPLATPSSSGDWRMGLNFAKDLIKYLEGK